MVILPAIFKGTLLQTVICFPFMIFWSKFEDNEKNVITEGANSFLNCLNEKLSRHHFRVSCTSMTVTTYMIACNQIVLIPLDRQIELV